MANRQTRDRARAMKWMVRFSAGGVGYGDFRWAPVGQWTSAPDWDPAPVCPGGLHGQGPGGWGYCPAGTRFEFCEIDETAGVVVVGGNKLKCARARILAVDREAWRWVLARCSDGVFPGGLTLEGYAFLLPPSLTTVGGALTLQGYPHPLPPGLTTVGGWLNLRGYAHPLPPSFTTVGGALDLRGYAHPLPPSLTERHE